MTSVKNIKPAKTTAAHAPAALKTILLATDFSPNAQTALTWAIELAKIHQARLVVVHATEPTITALDALAGPLDEEARRSLEQAVKQATGWQLQAAGEYHVGKPWQVIAAAARNAAADLIVVGTRGRTGYKRLFLGSTADRLVRTASTPVLVVHPDDASRAPRLRTILVPTDFSEEAALATSMAVRLLGGGGGKPGARIILLHSIELTVTWPTPELPTIMPEYWDEAEADARRRLEALAAPLRTGSLKVEVKIVRGYPVDAIEQTAREAEVDLIAMGAVGVSALERFFIGSVAERVLQHAPCPVLTVRRPDANDPIRLEA